MAWKEKVRVKLSELLGTEEIAKNACPLRVAIENETQKDGYRQIRFVFESERGAFVPCYLLVPDDGKKKYPVAICLQGHSSGFHNSVGILKYDGDKEYQPRGQFAVQAVKRGFAALAIEQRALGERRTRRHEYGFCTFTAMTELSLGRTIIGERVWDISRAIDALSVFNDLDLDKIVITGNSGGGTASFYAACIEERIKISVPSCSFCTFDSSILNLHHCPCNHIPHVRQWFDMGDLSCLIAPRELIVVAGKKDNIFPLNGVKEAFATAQEVYKAAGVPENCSLIVTDKGHWWCEDIVWDAIVSKCGKLGW